MAKFFKLKVKDVIKETTDAVSISFDLNAEEKKVFNYQAGQYLTFKTDINNEDIRRSYSICSSPFMDEPLAVAVKKVFQGKFSTFANDVLKPGDEIDVMTPMGNFHTNIDPKNNKKYVAFAAGSGITPIISIIKSVLKEEPDSTFTLFYSNKTVQSIIFRELIEDLKNIYFTRFENFHILSREDPGVDLFKGRLTGDKCDHILNAFPIVVDADEYFICGPEEMILGIKESLKKKNIDEGKIHYELFTSPTQHLGKKDQVVAAEPIGSFSSTVRIRLDGDESEFGLNSDGLPILDAALANGIDVPFACKGAVCCTCKARVIEGKVRMEMNYSLQDDELAAGYVLTCQAHPESEKVVIDYDS